MAYHRYFKSSGFYFFLGKIILKLLAIVAGIIAIYQLLQSFVHINIKEHFFLLTEKLHPAIVWTTFAVSETFLGLIPPDLFIAWGHQTQYPWLTTTFLALISYAGGIIAYGIGYFLSKNKAVKNYFENKHQKLTIFLRRWGGFFILLAALFPLPFSVATLIAGMVGYPLRGVIVFGLARIARFYLYAAVILGLL